MSRLDTTTTPSRSNDGRDMQPRGGKTHPHPFAKTRLAIGAAALAALLASCNDSGEYTGPILLSGSDTGASGAEIKGVDGGAIGDPQDVTGIVDDADDTVDDTDGVIDVVEDVTPSASQELDTEDIQIAVDTTNVNDGVNDGVNDAADDASAPAKDVTVVDSMADTVAETADTKPVEVKPLETAQSKTSEEICKEKKAELLAALKPGEPQCTQAIPGVGKKPGELVCSGTNEDPNCVVK